MYIHRQIRSFRDKLTIGRRPGQWHSLFAPYHGDERVAIDLETTSLDVSQAKIVSIGAVIIQANQVKASKRLDVRIRATAHLTKESVKIHLLRRVDLEDGLSLDVALQKLLIFIGNRPLVGYYIAYDLEVLDRSMRPIFDFGLPNRCVDVVNLFRRRAANLAVNDSDLRLGFNDIAEALDIPIVGRHTAVGDAITTAMMYVKMQANNH